MIRASGLNLRRGTKTLLNNCDFVIHPGERVGIVALPKPTRIWIERDFIRLFFIRLLNVPPAAEFALFPQFLW